MAFSALNFVFLTTSLATTSLNCFKSTSSKSSTFFFELFKLVMSSFLTLSLAAKSDASTPVTWSNSF